MKLGQITVSKTNSIANSQKKHTSYNSNRKESQKRQTNILNSLVMYTLVGYYDTHNLLF